MNNSALRDCFADSAVNLGRQQEIDLARAIPVFFLPAVHTVIECTPVERIYDPIPFFFNIVIGQPFGAPMFIFAMGACIHFSRCKDSVILMKRGLALFIGGFLLNFLRFFIPYMTGYALTGDHAKFITPLWYRVFGNDILQFAGLFFILLGIFLHFNLSNRKILIIAAGMSIFGSLVRHVDLNNPVLNIALGHIIGTQDSVGLVMSDFPIFNWFFVPACGYVFGELLTRMKDKDRFYRIFTPIPLILYTTFCIVEYVFSFGQMDSGATLVESENCYYHLLWYDAFTLVVFAVSILGVYHMLMKILPEFLKRFIFSLSRNITRVYIIHWFFVVMLTNVVLYSVRGTQELPIGWTLLLSAAIFMITYPLALLFERVMQRRREAKA